MATNNTPIPRIVEDSRVWNDQGNLVSGSYGPTAGNTKTAPNNKFSHNPDSGIITPAQDFELSFDPNVLDNYDTYTYHWK